MRSPITGYLERILEQTAHVDAGEPADYIPELAAADPDRAAVALCTVNGTVYAAGDADDEFSIQSLAKPFAYALALEDRGIEAVLEQVGVEPTGESFNELSLDPGTGRPSNPMINAGAIVTHTLIDETEQPADDRVRRLLSELAQRPIAIDEDLAASELATGSRNLGLAYLMHASGALKADPGAAVEGYVRDCSALVTTRDLALMAATIANGGTQPNTGRHLMGRRTVTHLLSVMATCGMYDAAGNWLASVGIPAKSGVGGGIIGVLPGQLGVAVFSPRLDEHGNSVRGVEMMRLLSEDLDLHLMTASRPARSALREIRTSTIEGHTVTVYVLQGDLVLSSIESLVHDLLEHPPATDVVVFDIARVDDMLPVALRTLSQSAAGLVDDGLRVIVVDPDDRLADLDTGHDRPIERWSRERLDRADEGNGQSR